MSCYCQAQTIHVCVCCHMKPCKCKSNHPKADSQRADNPSQQNANTIINEIEKNFADMLQKQLQKLSERKQKQIDGLQQMITKLKSEISKLQNRNKLDKENQNRLKEQVRKLNAKIKQLEQSLFKKDNAKKVQNTTTQYKKVEKDRPSAQKQVENKPNPVDQLKQQIIKQKTRIFQLEQLNKNHKQRLQRDAENYNKKMQELLVKIRQLENQLGRKQAQIQKFIQQKQVLKQKVEYLSRPKTQIEPIIIHKLTTQSPEIKTVYVDQPVQRTKIVEVERVIKQFIQPDRPVVNRIINCDKFATCKCNDSDEQSDALVGRKTRKYDKYREEVSERSRCVKDECEEVIGEYKNQRQQLLKSINERDSSYRLLQKKIQLCEKMHAKPESGRRDGPSIVQVTVYKDGQKQGSQSSGRDKKNTKSNDNANRNQRSSGVRNYTGPIQRQTKRK